MVLRNVSCLLIIHLEYPSGVPNEVKIRSKANDEPTAGYEEVEKNFATKYFIHRWVMGKEDRFFLQ